MWRDTNANDLDNYNSCLCTSYRRAKNHYKVHVWSHQHLNFTLNSTQVTWNLLDITYLPRRCKKSLWTNAIKVKVLQEQFDQGFHCLPWYFCLCCLCWGLTSQSTIFQSCRDGATASWVINQYFRGVQCLAQGHNTAAVGFKPPTSRSGVRHSTTEPPRSLTMILSTCFGCITVGWNNPVF